MSVDYESLKTEIQTADIDPYAYIQLCDCDFMISHVKHCDNGDDVCSNCGEPYEKVPPDECEDEIERLDNAIKAAEQWSDEYSKAPDQHASLITTESKIERKLREYFRGLADRSVGFVNWANYELSARTVRADETEVIVNIDDTLLGQEDALVIQAIYDPVTAAVALGIESGETIYQTSVGLSESSVDVQRAARDLVAQLVGKKLDKDGNIVANPNAKYRISDRTRTEIRESIRTSLSLGETITDAQARLQRTIRDPNRAMTIARTETVNAYQRGITLFGDKSGAVGKEWLSVNPNDICGQYAAQGVVPIDYFYDPTVKLKHPAAHPNCRCSIRLVYPEELGATNVDK